MGKLLFSVFYQVFKENYLKEKMCPVVYMYRAGVGLWRQVQNIFLLPGHGLCHDLHCGVLPQAVRRPGQVPGHSTNLTLLLLFCPGGSS